MRGSKRELTTSGFDEALQTVGSDAFRSPYTVGLRIPATRPPNAPGTIGGSRYLFLLAMMRFGAHEKGRLVGVRQLVTIGQDIPLLASTTIAPASNGLTLPQPTINVASTAGFPAVGTAFVTTSAGVQMVTYTGLTPTSLTGTAAGGGVGLMTTGGLVQAVIANYPLELEVKTPWWKFVDGNIAWHLHRVPPTQQNTTANLGNAEGLQFLYAQTPALMFQKTPTDVGGYVPPYGGQPPGNALIPDLATFRDMRFPWSSSHAWNSLDIEIEGPCDIALFASVLQTQPTLRVPLIVQPGVQLNTLQPEDGFIAVPANPADPKQQIGAAPNAIYWRIAGSLIFETPNMIPIPRELVEDESESSTVERDDSADGACYDGDGGLQPGGGGSGSGRQPGGAQPIGDGAGSRKSSGGKE